MYRHTDFKIPFLEGKIAVRDFLKITFTPSVLGLGYFSNNFYRANGCCHLTVFGSTMKKSIMIIKGI